MDIYIMAKKKYIHIYFFFLLAGESCVVKAHLRCRQLHTPLEISSTFDGLLPIYTCARGGRCTCSKRGQNLSAMHDLSVAYRPRRAARHYAWKAKRRVLPGRPIAVLVLMNLNRPDQWWDPHIPLPLVCPM